MNNFLVVLGFINTITVAQGLCGISNFTCTSGQCIESYKLCDGTGNCPDNSDETLSECGHMKCPPFAFKCAYGACIDRNDVCNGIENCNDGSDETLDLCKRISKRAIAGNDGCSLPPLPFGGQYEISCVKGFECPSSPGTTVSSRTYLIYSCEPGYELTGDSRYVFCAKNTWSSQPPKCEKFCKPLYSDSVELECSYESNKVNCSRIQRPFTVVKQNACKKYYHLPPRLQFSIEPFYNLMCLESGEWDAPLISCDPDCGFQRDKSAVPLINNGHNATYGEFPWHVGLYEVNETHPNAMIYFCGGSIFSNRAILTAAHCVTTAGGIRNVNSIKIAVGKYNSSWTTKDPYERRYSVREILVPNIYGGSTYQHLYDIAILELGEDIPFNDFILPVCIDWELKYSFAAGTFGTVAGWGFNEHYHRTEALQKIKMSIITQKTCKEMVPEQFKRFITVDKFCTLFNNGSGVQSGDSGGGFTLKGDEHHFIYGIVSIKKRDSNEFAAFTNVSFHKDWIKFQFNAIEKRKKAEKKKIVPEFECGRWYGRSPENVGELKIGEFPWHAGVYLEVPPTKLICGGSIISPKFIITAAHCLFSSFDDELRDERTLRVAVGKFRVAWTAKDTSEQKRQVKKIHLPSSYTRNVPFGDDIALLELYEKIIMSTEVVPICIDWESHMQIGNGTLGFVAGWGLSDNNNLNEFLKLVKMPHIDGESCLLSVPSSHTKYINKDKFCAFYQGTTWTMSSQNTGGGFTFERNGQHYLRGITTGSFGKLRRVNVFTNVSHHLPWLNNMIKLK